MVHKRLRTSTGFSVHGVFIARIGPYRHLILLEMIGGTGSPFLGRIEFPTLYPTIVPRIPVPADWSILPIAIRTVMHTIATRTISALGGLVMFTINLSIFLSVTKYLNCCRERTSASQGKACVLIVSCLASH